MAQFSNSGSSYVLSGILDPLQDTDAANKRYVDAAVANRRPIFANHYLRNYATNRNWQSGDLVYVTGRAYYVNAEYVFIQLDNMGRTQIFVFDDDTDTDNIKQIRNDWLTGVGRRVANASLTHQDTVHAVGNLELSRRLPDGSSAHGYLVTLEDTDQPSGGANPYAEFANLAVEEDVGFRTGTYEYVSQTQNNNNRTVDADWSFQSSEIDHFGIVPGPINVAVTDEAGDTAVIPSFTGRTAGVVKATGTGRNDSDHFLAGDGEFYRIDTSGGGLQRSDFSQSGNTLQIDGTGVYTPTIPADVNTTYTFARTADTDGTFTVTPSTGGAYNVTVAQAPTTSRAGLVPQLETAEQTTLYLQGDGTWQKLSQGNLTDVLGDIDAWTGRSQGYTVVQDTDTALTAGQIRFRRTIGGFFPSDTEALASGQINRVIVDPHNGQHANVITQMTTGSPIKISQGVALFVGELSAPPTVNAGIYDLRITSPAPYFTTGTFRTDTDVTFEFRPSVNNPVVRGDIEPQTIIAQDINGGEITPFHMSATDNAAATRKATVGYVPTTNSTTLDANTGFQWYRYDAYGAADAVRDELDRFKERVDEGIGEIPVREDSDVRRPREFTSIQFLRTGTRVTGVRFGWLEKDTEAWSALDDFFDDQLVYGGQDVTIHMQVSYQNAVTDTELTEIDFFINTHDPDPLLVLDRVNRFATFRIDTDGTNQASNVIALDDTHGNASAIPASDLVGGNGYWRNIHMFDGVGEYADLTSQFREIGDPVYNYVQRYNTVVPVIRDNDDGRTPNIRLAGLGTGLTYDSDTNRINASATNTTDDLTFRQVGNDVELLPDNTIANGVTFQASTTIGFVEDTGNNTIVQARVNANAIDSEHLADRAVSREKINTPSAGNSGEYLRQSATGLEWAAISDSGVEAGFGINVSGSTVSVDTEEIVDTNWFRSSAAAFSTSQYGVVSSVPNDEFNANRFLAGDNTWKTIRDHTNGTHTFTQDSDGLVPHPGSLNSTGYYLAGDGSWRHVSAGGTTRIFSDSEAGLAPPTGHNTGFRFLNDQGLWTDPHVTIDSDVVHQHLAFDARWDTDNHEIDFTKRYEIPAVPGTNGQRAWMILTFTNSGTNSSGSQPLEDSATLRLRGYTDNGQLVDTVVSWSQSDVPSGRGARGQNDVSAIWANAIGGNFPGFGQVNDIGQTGDNGFSIQLTHEGPIDTDTSSARYFVHEFQSSNYDVTATYAVPGVDRGYPANAQARGSFHTNGTPAKDTEVLITEVIVPEFGQNLGLNHAGLVPPPALLRRTEDYYLGGNGEWRHIREATRDTEHIFDHEHAGVVPASGTFPDSEAVLTPGGWQNANWVDRRSAHDVVEKIDALAKLVTNNGMYWNTNGTLNRVIVSIRIGGQIGSDSTFTKGLFWDANNRLTSIQYHFGSHPGTGAFIASDLVATKTLHWNAQGQLVGTTIT